MPDRLSGLCPGLSLIVKQVVAVAVVALGLVGSAWAQPAPATEPPLWRLDAGYSHSQISRADRRDWKEGAAVLTRKLNGRTALNGRVDISRRYDSEDILIGAGASHRFNSDFGGALSAYVTPDADFLARWAVQADVDYKLTAGGGGWLGPTIATLLLRHKDYASGDSDNADPGIVQYLSGGHWITARWINTFERGVGKRVGGYSLRGDWQATADARVFAGYAIAPESSDDDIVDVRSRFFGIVYDLNDRTALRLDYAGEDRKNSYLRNTLSVGITRRF